MNGDKNEQNKVASVFTIEWCIRWNRLGLLGGK
jgi:hypothetical protein